MAHPILAVGWDVGGWKGTKQGLAAIHYVPGQAPSLVGKPKSVGLSNGIWTLERLVEIACLPQKPNSDYRLIVGIDAPFGFPEAYNKLLSGNCHHRGSTGREIDNPYAYRETDRIVAKRFKKPLSASFDKLGNNATVAIHHLNAWRLASGMMVIPFDDDDGVSPVAIEVYPAIARTRRGGDRPSWITRVLDLAPTLIAGSDAQDALICAALATAFAADGRDGFPQLQKPDQSIPPGEGWICFPSDLDWRDESAKAAEFHLAECRRLLESEAIRSRLRLKVHDPDMLERLLFGEPTERDLMLAFADITAIVSRK